MPKVFTSDSQKTGEIGENVAVKFLMKHGFAILDRNYTKKWGEIDIVAEKDNLLHFVEVKSVVREGVSHETLDEYRPEDNMHPWKLKRLSLRKRRRKALEISLFLRVSKKENFMRFPSHLNSTSSS